MGERSEYFEDFPEENPANYLGNHFNPAGAKAQRDAKEAAEKKLRADQRKLEAEIAAIVQKHKTAGKSRLVRAGGRRKHLGIDVS